MATLNLQVIFDAKDKITGPMKAIIGGSNELTKAFKKTNAELKNLKDQQNAVNRYRELSTAIDKTRTKLAEYRNEHSQLKNIAKTKSLTEEQTKKMQNLEQGIRRLKSEQKNYSEQVTNSVRDMQQYGYTVKDLDHQESQLKDKLFVTTMELNKRRGALDNAAKAQEKYARTQAILQKGSDIAKKGMMVAGAGAAALVVPAKLSIDFESSMADIAKVVDGLKDETGKITPAYAAMSKEIIAMSSRLPMAANDIAAIVAAGGQSGIAANELTRFAESAVKMGVAFDITAEESGQAMAEMRSAFRMSQDQVVVLADKINYLGNNTPAAAKGIMDIVKRVGPLGEVSGFASGSIAALGATMRGMGIQEEVAATGIQNMMLSLVAGESATKAQKVAYRELGFESAQVAKDMQKDAEATTLKILEAVNRLPKDEQAAMLQSLFGKESIKAIATMLTNMDALQDNFNKVGDATKYAGSMEKEYAARAATTANSIQLLKNKLAGVAITIGNNLLPIINAGATAFGNIVSRIQTWADANPALASTITKVAVGAIAIIGGVSALALGVITLLGPLAMLKMTLTTLGGGAGIAAGALKMMLAPMKMVGTAIMMTGKAFLWAGKALLANPMILAVTLLATAAYLIYRNWTPIKAFFSDIWNSIAIAAGNVWKSITNWASNTWATLVNGANQLWAGVKTAFNNGITFIKDIIKSVDSVFANNPILNLLIPFIGIPRLIIANWSTISGFFQRLWSSITGAVSTGITIVSSLFNTGFTFILGLASSVWSSITTFTSNTWSSITSMVNTGITAVSGVISTGFNAVSTFMASVWSRIKGIVSTAWSVLCNIFLTVTPLGFIIRNFDQIIGFLTGLASRFLSIGRNIVDGLIKGILSGFDKLKGVWQKINSYMPDFMRKKMDIHSPSRVMAGLGGHIVDGIGVGMNNRTPALQNQFGNTLNTFSDQSPINRLAGNNQNTPTLKQTPALSTKSSVIFQSNDQYTIHVSVDKDMKVEDRRSLIKEIREELDRRDREKQAIIRRHLGDQE